MYASFQKDKTLTPYPDGNFFVDLNGLEILHDVPVISGEVFNYFSRQNLIMLNNEWY